MKPTHILTAMLVFCLLAISPLLSAQSVDKTFSGVKKIKISTSSGDCIIKKGAGSEVLVSLTYTYSSEKFTPVMEQEGSTLVLKEQFERGSASGESTWTLTIPQNMELDFNTGSGSIRGEGLAIELKGNSGSGNVELNNIEGTFRLNSGSGHVVLMNLKGEVSANSGSGNITVDGANAEVKANVGSGNIKIYNATGRFSANSGSGSVKVDKLILTDKSSFNSGSGDVKVVLAASPAHNLSVNSGSGDAIVDFGGNKLEGTVVMTANKKNGEIRAPFNFDKTEEIEDGGNQTRIRKTAKLSEKNIEIKIGTGSGSAVVEK